MCSFTVVPLYAQIHTTVTHSPGKGAPQTKKGNFRWKETRFGPKIIKKLGFSGFSHLTALIQFAISL